MKRVLIGYLVGSNMCGIDTYLFHLASVYQGQAYQFDFLTNEINEQLEIFAAKTNSHLIEIPTLKHPVRYYHAIMKIVQNNYYDVAYFNISEAFHSIGAIAAKKGGIKKVIIHSHASGVDGHSKFRKMIRTVIHCFFKYFVLDKYATDLYACSSIAAEWMFSSKMRQEKGVRIISNAIEVDKYQFKEEIRNKWRDILGLQGHFVLGHVSGFTPVKNISFLIDIVNEVRKLDDTVKLLIIGEGIDSELIKQKVKALNLEKYVVFTGARKDVNELMQAMDAFVFPSLFEGLGIVVIEAQMTGLCVYTSDVLPKEVKLSEKCQFISLKKSPKEWAEIVLAKKQYDRAYTDFSKAEYCFDIEKQKKELLELL